MRRGIQKLVWLHIFSEGGIWTPEGVAQQFNMTRQQANVMLHNMATRTGNLQRGKERGRTTFSVIGGCQIPKGVTVDEVHSICATAQAERTPAGPGLIAEAA